VHVPSAQALDEQSRGGPADFGRRVADRGELRSHQRGEAAALSVLLAVVTFVLSFAFLRFTSRRQG
jgi:hypothetical protein